MFPCWADPTRKNRNCAHVCRLTQNLMESIYIIGRFKGSNPPHPWVFLCNIRIFTCHVLLPSWGVNWRNHRPDWHRLLGSGKEKNGVVGGQNNKYLSRSQVYHLTGWLREHSPSSMPSMGRGGGKHRLERGAWRNKGSTLMDARNRTKTQSRNLSPHVAIDTAAKCDYKQSPDSWDGNTQIHVWWRHKTLINCGNCRRWTPAIKTTARPPTAAHGAREGKELEERCLPKCLLTAGGSLVGVLQQ